MANVLFSYAISPYVAKVRAILRYKQVPFREETVHPLRRGEVKRLSGQLLVPIMDFDGHVVADSTAIAQAIEERFPEPSLLPADPAQRGLVKLLEEWADEGLATVVQPLRWLIPYNFRATQERMRASYPPGRADDLTMATVARAVQLKMIRKYGFGRPAQMLNRFAEVMDYLDAVLKPTGFLVGDKPTIADFAVYGFLSQLEDLDGWETLRARRRVAKLLKTLGGGGDEKDKAQAQAPVPAPRAESYDAHDQAIIDASRLRRAKVK